MSINYFGYRVCQGLEYNLNLPPLALRESYSPVEKKLYSTLIIDLAIYTLQFAPFLKF